MRWLVYARPFLLFGLLSSLPLASQTILHSFDGDAGPGLAACQSLKGHCDRPDMDVAVNGSQVVQATWQNIRVYDSTGRLLHTTPTADLIRNSGLAPLNPRLQMPIEPHVVFDEFIQRWIMTATGQNDDLLVSATSDATGAWGGVSLSCLQSGPCLDNDEAIHLGFDKNGVYACAFHVGDLNLHTSRLGYDCFAVPSAEVLAIAQRIPPAHINRAHNLPLDVYPAIDDNPAKLPAAPALFLAKTCDLNVPGGCQNPSNFTFHWLVDTFIWSGPIGAFNGEQDVKTAIGSTSDLWIYNKPCCGTLMSIPQSGSPDVAIRASESHRIINVVQRGSHVYAVAGSGPCATDCGLQGVDTGNLAIFVDLDCAKPSACIVSQTAKISGSAFNAEFPTIGIDAAGNIGIVALSSTADTDLSLLLWIHKATDPPNTFTGPTTIISGTQPYTCLADKGFVSVANPVGINTALDPTDGLTLWTSHQWSHDATRCTWNTRIIAYRIAPAPTQPKPSPRTTNPSHKRSSKYGFR